MRLHDNEMSMYCAVLLMNPNRYGLTERGRIAALRNTFAKSLKYRVIYFCIHFYGQLTVL